MRPVDSVLGFFGGRARGAGAVELAPGEYEIAREVAQLRPGSMTSVGGDLVLSTLRLVFRPLDVRDSGSLLTWSLDEAALPGLGRVHAGDGARLPSPPTRVVEATDGQTTEIGILASRFSPSAGRADRAARDRMVAAVAGRLLPER